MGVLMINDMSVGTTSDAKHTPFNPSGTDLTATNVEDAIKEVNGSDINADDVIYDNSNTGLPANVQGAIDKTTGNISSLDTVELTATAAHAHAAGSTFLWIGQLVKVTTAIAVGDTIAIGTNVTETNVMELMSELNSNLAIRNVTTETSEHVVTNLIDIKRIYNFVIINGYIKLNFSTANQYVLYGVINSCPPTSTVRIPCAISNEPWTVPKESGLLLVEDVDGHGQVSIRSSTLTGTNTVYFNLIYACK